MLAELPASGRVSFADFLKNLEIEGVVITKLIRKMGSVWLKDLKYFNE